MVPATASGRAFRGKSGDDRRLTRTAPGGGWGEDPCEVGVDGFNISIDQTSFPSHYDPFDQLFGRNGGFIVTFFEEASVTTCKPAG